MSQTIEQYYNEAGAALARASELCKFNPNHDHLGRFTSGGGKGKGKKGSKPKGFTAAQLAPNLKQLANSRGATRVKGSTVSDIADNAPKGSVVTFYGNNSKGLNRKVDAAYHFKLKADAISFENRAKKLGLVSNGSRTWQAT